MAIASVFEVSPFKPVQDSPLRQLHWELQRLAITTQEETEDRIDREYQKREVKYKTALADAIARHERVRQNAEAEKARLEKQIQEEQERIEELIRKEEQRQLRAEKQAALERIRLEATAKLLEEEQAARRQKAERERQENETARAVEAAEAARALKEKQASDDKAKAAEDRRKAESERKTKEAAIAAAQRSQSLQSVPTSDEQLITPIWRPAFQKDEIEAEHDRYLEIHKRLKQLRNFMDDQGKQNPKLKTHMGDARREIRKCVGQLVEGGGKANQGPLARIKNNLLEAMRNFPQPATDFSKFVAGDVPSAGAPAIAIFLLHHFAKAIVSQFANEAAVNPKLAEPIGTLAINIFAMDDFRCYGLSLIDILIAKYHVVCPPIFGVYGSETTDEGRKRLGWQQEYSPDGPFVQDQRHWDRTTGLGAGFAALALRYFENSRMQSPYPPYHFWNSMAMNMNVPDGEVTDTHLVLVRAMVANNEARILRFFGDAAKVILTYATNEYPKKAVKRSAAAMILSGLGDMWKKEKRLYL